MQSRWAVEIEGNVGDLENLRDKCNKSISSPTGVFISKFRDVYALRCANWDSLPDASTVAEIAQEELSLLLACLRSLDGSGEMSVGTVFELNTDSTIHNRTRQTSFELNVRKRPEDRSSPTEFGQLTNVARSNHHLRRALAVLGREPTWHELYICLEEIEDLYGGERKLHRQFPSKESVLRRIKRTANSYRHSRGKFQPVSSPIPINEAYAELRSLIMEILRLRVDQAWTAASVTITDVNYPEGEVIGLKRLVLAQP